MALGTHFQAVGETYQFLALDVPLEFICAACNFIRNFAGTVAYTRSGWSYIYINRIKINVILIITRSKCCPFTPSRRRSRFFPPDSISPRRSTGPSTPHALTPSWTLKKLSLSRCAAGKGLGKILGQRKAPERVSKFPVIYEEPAVAEKIPIRFGRRSEDPRFSSNVVYESYKPRNLREMQDYINFVLNFRKVLPNRCFRMGEDVGSTIDADDILSSPQVSQEIKEYYNTEIQTRLPEQVLLLLETSLRRVDRPGEGSGLRFKLRVRQPRPRLHHFPHRVQSLPQC